MAPFRFLDLPAEIRNEVYAYLVVVGSVFYTPDWYEYKVGGRFKGFDRYDKPSLQILQTCRKLHAEVEPFYLARNKFVLPSMLEFHQPLRSAEPHPPSLKDTLPQHASADRVLFSKKALTCVKSFSMAFCFRSAMPLTVSHFDWHRMTEIVLRTFDNVGPVHRMHLAHKVAKARQRNVWLRQIEAVKRFTSPLDLLEVDFTNAYCPFGCCREYDDVLFLFLADLKPKVLRLLGLRVGDMAEVRQKVGNVEYSTDWVPEEVSYIPLEDI
jgi:hypothetical protein